MLYYTGGRWPIASKRLAHSAYSPHSRFSRTATEFAKSMIQELEAIFSSPDIVDVSNEILHMRVLHYYFNPSIHCGEATPQK